MIYCTDIGLLYFNLSINLKSEVAGTSATILKSLLESSLHKTSMNGLPCGNTINRVVQTQYLIIAINGKLPKTH